MRAVTMDVRGLGWVSGCKPTRARMCLYLCKCMCAQTRVCAERVCMSLCLHAFEYVFDRARVCDFVPTWVWAYVSVFVYACAYMAVRVHICTFYVCVSYLWAWVFGTPGQSDTSASSCGLSVTDTHTLRPSLSHVDSLQSNVLNIASGQSLHNRNLHSVFASQHSLPSCPATTTTPTGRCESTAWCSNFRRHQ